MSQATDNANEKLRVVQTFTGTGTVGKASSDPYPIQSAQSLVVLAENVGAGNTILVKGRIKGQTSYSTIATVTGTTPSTVDVSKIDEIYFDCTVYSAAGSPRLVASTFFDSASGGGGGSSGTLQGRNANVALGNGVQTASPVFSSAMADTAYSISIIFKNLVDGSPIFLIPIITAKLTTGFTVIFNAPTDSVNYIMEYTVSKEIP